MTGRPPKLREDERERLIDMVRRGHRYSDVATHFDISTQTVSAFALQAGIRRRGDTRTNTEANWTAVRDMHGLPHADPPGGETVNHGWWDDAECLGMDLALFFPDSGDVSDGVKATCRRCPVQAPCLAEALERPVSDQFGYRGGHTADGRRALLRSGVRR